ncbi:MAG: endonuclease/exonuclease/phosphatase family protein, partial [Lutibacter sp.]|nr:endonuclease/exonuclease/phosphatase family protein [Lutibacter sp.]
MKRLSLLLILIFVAIQPIFGQKKYDIKTVAFYNLENLFDIVDDTLKLDESSPIMAIKENRAAIYQLKLNNMAKVL